MHDYQSGVMALILALAAANASHADHKPKPPAAAAHRHAAVGRHGGDAPRTELRR